MSQTSATLKLYALCTAVTGTVTTSARAFIYDCPDGAEDDDRPGNTLVATSDDRTPSANTWTTFTFTATLTAGATYWFLITNVNGTPASNYFTYATRGTLDGFFWQGQQFASCGSDVAGHSADPTAATGSGVYVIAYSDGTLDGFIWAGSAAHASNANDRGNRVVFLQDMVVSGVTFPGVRTTSIVTFEINHATNGANLLTLTLDKNQINNAQGWNFPPVLLSAGVHYDFVCTYSGSTAIGTSYNALEASPPADVAACIPGWLIGTVSGATPGSYSLTAGSAFADFIVLIDPAPRAFISGGHQA